MKNNERIPEYIRPFIDKYKYPVLVFLIGLLIVIFGGTNSEKPIKAQETPDEVRAAELKIQEALGKIEGVGRAEVILSLKNSQQNIYAKQEKYGENEEIAVISEGGSQKALLEYTRSPTFMGALIVCDGGENSMVKLKITDAVKALTGISSQNIIITKMKK